MPTWRLPAGVGSVLKRLEGRRGLLLCCRAPAALCVRPAHVCVLLRIGPGVSLPG